MIISYLSKLLYITIFILYSLTAFTQGKASETSRALSKENYILILSSYQYHNPWATTTAKKIQRQLEKESSKLICRIVYASSDIQQTMLASRLNMQKAFSQARLTPDIIVPRILVLVGDESWMLYRIMNLRGLWEKIPVVLCGVNDKILKDYSTFFAKPSFADSLMIPLTQSEGMLKVTGVLRDNVNQKLSTFIQKTSPSLKELIYLSGGSYTDEHTWNQQHRIFSSTRPDIKLSYFNSRQVSEDSICNYINRLSPDSAAFLFNTYPSFLPALKLPAYSSSDEGACNNNTVGGYYTSTDQFAQQTTKLIMRIYNGASINSLPFQYVQNHRFCLNAQAPYLPKSRWEKDELPELLYYNIPPPFLIRHLRPISLILLITSISVIGLMIYFKTRKYQLHTQSLLTKYKNLPEKFQIVYDNMPVALLIFNDKGKLLYENPAVKRLQYSWHSDLTKELNLFSDLITHQQLQEKIRHKENISEIFPVQDGKIKTRPGGIHQEACNYFRLVVRYIPDDNNNTDNILVMLIDNSDIYREKIETKRIRNLFNFAMNKASIGIAEYNLYSTTGIATDSWCKHMNLQCKPSFPSMFQHVEEQDRKTILDFYEQAYHGKSDYFNREIKVIHPDGSPHYLREQIKVMEYNPTQGQVWVAELNQDIDKEKQYAAEIQAATGKARESGLLKNTFIANMSHEIRTPLNAIVGFSDLLITTRDVEIRKEMIHYIEENNEVLLRQVNDIIDLAKMESGSMSFALSETDVNELFQDLTASHQFKANQKKLTLKCRFSMDELIIVTDKIRIRQVLSNFISNAINYTEKGTIDFGYRLEKDTLYAYVTDTGIGIPEDHLPKIFNRFFRSSATLQGYGLGLSIAQVIIQGLKGEIGVDSEEGKGSTFWFRLPVGVIWSQRLSPAKKVAESGCSPISGQMPHILVIGDDASNFTLIQFMLKNAFHITHARNSEEAVKLFKENPQDLILMDIKMPKKNDYETTLAIRELAPRIPIIATTAFAFSKDEMEALNNGFNAYLTKPLEKRLLLATIHHWLNYRN